MAADSDGTLTAVVICEGDFHDPDFPKKFKSLLGKLKSILEQPKRTKKFIKVNKVRLDLWLGTCSECRSDTINSFILGGTME